MGLTSALLSQPIHNYSLVEPDPSPPPILGIINFKYGSNM